MPTDNVRLILNKAESDVGIDIEQVTKLFPQGFESVLPYAKEVSRSINLGMPVMAASPTAEISSLMAGGMKLVLPDGPAGAASTPRPPRRRPACSAAGPSEPPGGAPMKLSEKLAALEEEESREAAEAAAAPAARRRRRRSATRSTGARGHQHVGRDEEEGPRARARRGGSARCRASPPRSSPPRCGPPSTASSSARTSRSRRSSAAASSRR